MMRKIAFSIGILAVLILTIPAIGSAAEVRGVTDTEVVVGITTPLSGPAALWGVTGLGAESLGRPHQLPGRDPRPQDQGDLKRRWI